jgi:serine phosphatase RsbU (regulator of sigma subunit)
VKDGMDISLIRKDHDKIAFAGAYSPLWLVRKTDLLNDSEKTSRGNVIGEDESLLEFKSNKQHIGLFDYMMPFHEVEIPIHLGDTVYLFTDGFADQFGGMKGKKFKYKPFKNYLLGLSGPDMTQQKEALSKEFHNWKGDLEQLDDVCVIRIRFD